MISSDDYTSFPEVSGPGKLERLAATGGGSGEVQLGEVSSCLMHDD